MSRYCARSIPALPMSAKAFPKASITEAIRKLPLSLTKFAMRLLSDGKRALANLIKQWLALRDCLALSRPAPRRGWQMPRHPGAQTQGPRRMVVGKHGDDNVASCSIARRLGELRATLNKVLGLRLGAVIDREVTAIGLLSPMKPTCIASCLLRHCNRFGTGWLRFRSGLLTRIRRAAGAQHAAAPRAALARQDRARSLVADERGR